MPGLSKQTTNHDVIRKWAEKRSGQPATVRRTAGADEPGILRIDFPGYSGQQSLEPISWDEFFEKFDDKNLVFVYQDKTAAGKPSRFCKLVSRESAKTKSHVSTRDRKTKPSAPKRASGSARAKTRERGKHGTQSK